MSEYVVAALWGHTREGLSVPDATGTAEIRLGDGSTRQVTLAGHDWWPTDEDWAFIGDAEDVTIAGVTLEVVRAG